MENRPPGPNGAIIKGATKFRSETHSVHEETKDTSYSLGSHFQDSFKAQASARAIGGIKAKPHSTKLRLQRDIAQYKAESEPASVGDIGVMGSSFNQN